MCECVCVFGRQTYLALLQAEELDISPHRLPRADRGHDENLFGAAELERFVLGGDLTRGLVRGDVRAGRHEPEQRTR